VTSTELAKRLSDAALAYRAKADPDGFALLQSLAGEAAAHVRRVGHGTVDHIVLSSVLKLIVVDVSAVDEVLQHAGWKWFT
jgi:hypothetical protein